MAHELHETTLMKAIEGPHGVKIYNLSVGKTLPEWLSEKKKRALSKDEDYRRRIEILQVSRQWPATDARTPKTTRCPNFESLELSVGTEAISFIRKTIQAL